MKQAPTVVSLFVGCGGLDLGFKEQGFDLVYSCDIEPSAIDVYQRNVDSRAYVRDVTSDLFHDEMKALASCDVVLGGFPCQGFSKAGPKNSEDERNLLYLEMKKAIDTLKPSIFIAENVDGLGQNFKGKFLELITSDFQKIGYDVEYKVLDAANFGVPQHRRRIFFVGKKRGDTSLDFSWPRQTHFSKDRNGESKLKRTPDILDNCTNFNFEKDALTVRDAIYDIRELNSEITDHKVTNKWSSDYQRIMEVIKEGQKLCNVRFSDSSVYTWQIPEVFGKVDKTDIQILETIGKNRRHKKYGNIPNGNPLAEDTICELSGLKSITKRLLSLVEKGYLKEKNDGYDLKGAMFCSGLFKRPHWDAPSQTILTNFDNPRYFLHPEENRPFSLRECARLQGFPDNFVFTTSNDIKELKAGYKLVGNAVTPVLGRLFAKSVKSALIPENNNENTRKPINNRTKAA